MHETATSVFRLIAIADLVWFLVAIETVHTNSPDATMLSYLEGVAPCLHCLALVLCFYYFACKAFPGKFYGERENLATLSVFGPAKH